MRKAQISGQIFIYIMAIVIAGLVLLFGVRFVGQQLENQDKILYTRFVNGVSNAVDGTRFRSIDQVEYKVPSDYSAVCLVDYEVNYNTFVSADTDSGGIITSDYPLILDEISIRPSGPDISPELRESNTNLFLIDSDGVVSAESVGKVKLEHPYYFCSEVISGYVELQFEGVRGGVKVTEWEE